MGFLAPQEQSARFPIFNLDMMSVFDTPDRNKGLCPQCSNAAQRNIYVWSGFLICPSCQWHTVYLPPSETQSIKYHGQYILVAPGAGREASDQLRRRWKLPPCSHHRMHDATVQGGKIIKASIASVFTAMLSSEPLITIEQRMLNDSGQRSLCLLYTSDAADE